MKLINTWRPIALALAAVTILLSPVLTSPASAAKHHVTKPIGKPLGDPNDEVVVQGDTEEINHRDLAPNKPRYLNTSDRNSQVTREEWVSKGWDETDFNAMRAQNQGLCVRVTKRIAKSYVFMKRIAELQPEAAALLPRYDDMLNEIKNATYVSYGGNIISSGLGFLFGPIYGGMNLATNFGDAAKTTAWRHSMELQNEHGRFDAKVSMLDLDQRMMWQEEFIDYLGQMGHFCAKNVVHSMPVAEVTPDELNPQDAVSTDLDSDSPDTNQQKPAD